MDRSSVIMSSTRRCAVCKYFRRRCPSNCIFSPHFPPNNPQRFASLHKIYGACNIGKMLQMVIPGDVRSEMVESLYYEAKCRIQDPVYGCVGIISHLHQQIHDAQTHLAKTQAEIAFLLDLHSSNKYCTNSLLLPLSLSEPITPPSDYHHHQQYNLPQLPEAIN